MKRAKSAEPHRGGFDGKNLRRTVGYQPGNQAIINGWNEQELLNNVINAANDGTLQIKK